MNIKSEVAKYQGINKVYYKIVTVINSKTFIDYKKYTSIRKAKSNIYMVEKELLNKLYYNKDSLKKVKFDDENLSENNWFNILYSQIDLAY